MTNSVIIWKNQVIAVLSSYCRDSRYWTFELEHPDKATVQYLPVTDHCLGGASLIEREDSPPLMSLTRHSIKGEGAPNKKKWAELLKRSFAIDILECSACGGKMRLIATIKDPLVIRKILDHLGLPFEPPKRMPPRAPPQMDMYSSDDNFSQTSPDYDAF